MKRTNRRFFCFGVSGMLAVGALQSLPAKESELSGNFEALIPANFTIDDDLTPYLPNVKQALKRRDEASTAALIAASKSLFNAGAHEQFLCGNSFLSVTNTSVEPLRHPRVLFDAVLDELLSREGKPVFVWMQQLLLSENLGEGDKRTIWNGLKRKSGIESPIVLQATDPSQTRSYILRMVTDSKTEVEVKKGDTLLRIAKRFYPELSVWSGVDIISFMNGLVSDDLIYVGSKLKIYPFRIIRNEPVDQSGADATKTGL